VLLSLRNYYYIATNWILLNKTKQNYKILENTKQQNIRKNQKPQKPFFLMPEAGIVKN
jgi:hypothetical protein